MDGEPAANKYNAGEPPGSVIAIELPVPDEVALKISAVVLAILKIASNPERPALIADTNAACVDMSVAGEPALIVIVVGSPPYIAIA